MLERPVRTEAGDRTVEGRGRADTLDYPAARLDELLASTASAHPDRVALQSSRQRYTYAELDEAVTRCATALRQLADPGEVVAVASVLEPEYAIVYYGALRAGLPVLPVVPMLREPQLVHVLSRAGARVGLLSTEMIDRVQAVRAGVPRLTSLVALFGPARVPTLLDLLPDAAAPGGTDLPGDSVDGVVCAPAALHFTSGTTGLPKCVALTHANVVANALQTAHTHRLGPDSVSLVSFPTYHPMHLNSAVVAGARQVLHSGPDPVEAVHLACEHSATHFYTLPARLIQLTGDPRLTSLRMPTVRFVASGGSALPAAVAETLSNRFGVPVVQGYGLAETAPLTHFDDPDEPAAGSVGRPLPDTECRTVDLDTQQVLPLGSAGAVQVRGPQVMAGYVGEDVGRAGLRAVDLVDGSAVDADGWFCTGDVGTIDRSGRLRLIDRTKDIFKYDNFLISPTELEAALAAHPAVADSVVLDHPDGVHGAVPHAFVVLRRHHGPDDLPARVRAVVDAVNAELPSFKQIRHAEPVESIPRSPIGKIARRELRHALHTRLSGGSTMVVLVNRFTLTAAPEEFERVFAASSDFMRSQAGFLDHTLVRSLRNPNVYINIAHWDSAESHLRVVGNESFGQHIRELASVARAEPDLYAVVQSVDTARR